jgi:hypothetical protein
VCDSTEVKSTRTCFRASSIDDCSLKSDTAKRIIECFVDCTGFRSHINATPARRFFEDFTDIAGSRVNDKFRARLFGDFPPSFKRVYGSDEVSTCDPCHLHRHQPNGTESEDGNPLANADFPIPNSRHREVQWIIADSLFPRHVVWHFEDTFGAPCMRFLEVSVMRDALADFKTLYIITDFNNFSDAHIPKSLWKICAVVPVICCQFGAAFGRAEFDLNADMIRGDGTIFILS